MYDMHDFFLRKGGDSELFGTWVLANVTLHNSPENLATDKETGITAIKAGLVDDILHVKAIISSQGFNDDKLLAAKENPFRIPPISLETGGLFRGDKVYLVLIPDIVNLHGYEASAHARKHNLSEEWATFTPADCNLPGVRAPRATTAKKSNP